MKKAWLMGPVLLGLVLVLQVKAADPNYNVVRSQDLIGKTVKNEAGADLGKLEDYIINIKDGSIVYGVLQYGDTLGFGGKLFAIPPQALTLAADGKSVRLNVDKDELEKAQGFDANKWPTEADARWGKSSPTKDSDPKNEPKKDETKKDEPRKDDAKKDDSQANDKMAYLRRVSSLIGTSVKNKKGEDLGSIQGIVFDLKAKKVLYAGMAYGGVAGVGSKYFAVPWEAMEFVSPTLKAGDRAFLISVEKSELEQSQGFDTKSWPTVPDKMFTKTERPKPSKP
jgi:sporulation protein YlmC with PRC-barrel domain